MTPRSYLFVPANDPVRVTAALDSGADVVILDLEDTVAKTRKQAARDAALAVLAGPRPCALHVRVNGLDEPWALEDFIAVVPARPDAIIVPKIESARDLRAADWIVTQIEDRAGETPARIPMLPIIESARGFAGLDDIAAHMPARVERFIFGAGDLSVDLDLMNARDEGELAHARSRLSIASRNAGIGRPVDKIWLGLDDEAGLRASAVRGRGAGFAGKVCLSPAQVPVVHEVLAPTSEEIASAKRIIEAFEASVRRGDASIEVDGQFVDYPIARAAQALVERSE